LSYDRRLPTPRESPRRGLLLRNYGGRFMSKQEQFPKLEKARKDIVKELSSFKRKKADNATSNIELLKIIALELIEINEKLDIK